METIISKRQADSDILHRKDVEVQYLERMREISRRRGRECSAGSWGYLQRRVCTKLQFQHATLATYYWRNIVALARGREQVVLHLNVHKHVNTVEGVRKSGGFYWVFGFKKWGCCRMEQGTWKRIFINSNVPEIILKPLNWEGWDGWSMEHALEHDMCIWNFRWKIGME